MSKNKERNIKVTRNDIARAAGVSTATVSYVMNGKNRVSEETRNRVLKVIEDLDYKPDLIARSLITGETKQLAIVVDDILNPYYGEIIDGFESAALKKGYFVNICTGRDKLDEYLDSLVSRSVDGIFIVVLPTKFHIEKIYGLIEKKVKVVMTYTSLEDLKYFSVVFFDAKLGMKMAFDHLIGLGHKKIAYISGLGKKQKFDKRVEEYLLNVKEHNLGYANQLLVDGKFFLTTNQEGYDLTQSLIKSGKEFSAVICTNDVMAIGAIKALKEAGYRVPQDVSVIGFDGISLGEFVDPPLTSISLSARTRGEKAFDLLYSNIKKDTTGCYIDKLELIPRESTGPAKS